MSGGKSLFTKGNSKPSTSTEEISAFLGKETVFEGKMSFQGVFRLDGKFEGEIFDSGTLIVGESAIIKGKIWVNMIIINGHVEGEVNAHERVEIHSAGKLYGTLSTPVLTINEGGILEGHCNMNRKLDKEDNLPLISQNENHSLSA